MEILMKGYALTIDVTFGSVLVIFMLVAATSYTLSSYTSGIGDVSMKRIATDVIAVLDYNGTLDTLDENTIRSGINSLLPPNLEMGVNITVYDTSFAPVQEIDIDYATDKNRYAGKWNFMTFNGNSAEGFAVADYWVAIG